MSRPTIILASALLLGLTALACQRTEETQLADMKDTTSLVAPDTSAIDTTMIQGTPAVTPESTREPEKEVVVVREPAPAREAPRPAPRRRPAPRVEEPRPAPRPPSPPSSPARVTVPAGTNLFVTTETALSTKSNQVGDPVSARTAENVNVDGQVVIPAGALIEGHVAQLKSAGNPGETAYIDLAFDRVRLQNGDWLPFSGALAGKAGEEVKGSANVPRNVAIGGAAGAVLGQVIGHDAKSTVIGAVIGAGAGAAAGQATRDTYVVVPAGSRLNIQITNAMSVPVR